MAMADLLRDTTLGHMIRLLSNSRYLKYAEESDPSVAELYFVEKRSAQAGVSACHDQDIHKAQEHSNRSAAFTDGSSDSNKDAASSSDGASASEAQRVIQYSSEGRSNIGEVNPRGEDASRVQSGTQRIVTWYSSHDPENPRNWSLSKRIFVTFQICLLTTSVYIGSSIYSAGTQSIMETFEVSSVGATLGLTLFVLGYGVGPMLWSPLSEVPLIGRNPIYIGTLAVFVAFQAAVALAKNYGMLMAFRFLTGVFGSPVLATGGASVTDIWIPKKQAYPMAIWGLFAVCGPLLGPVVGNFAVQYGPIIPSFTTASWTWPIWILMWLSGFCLIFLIVFLPETSANNILLRRTKRLRKITGNDSLTCEAEISAANMTVQEVAMTCIVRALTLNFTEPMVLFLNLYIALVYGLLFAWLESIPIVFTDVYHFTLGIQGLAYLGIFVGVIITIILLFIYIAYVIEPQFDGNGNLQPEKRLPPAFVGAFCIPICLFWFGWSARPEVHWIVPIIGSSLFGPGGFLMFQSIMNYLPDAYPEYAASVLAGNDMIRSCFGAGFPLFAGAMYKNLGIGWASSTLGFISIAFIPIPFVLWKYGATLRKNHSKIARKDI